MKKKYEILSFILWFISIFVIAITDSEICDYIAMVFTLNAMFIIYKEAITEVGKRLK